VLGAGFLLLFLKGAIWFSLNCGAEKTSYFIALAPKLIKYKEIMKLFSAFCHGVTKNSITQPLTTFKNVCDAEA
jgi:hypothetical protein